MKQKPQYLLTILGLSLGLALFFVAPGVEAKAESPADEISIAGFESGSENWQGAGSLETNHTKQGKNSLKLTSQGFNWAAQSSIQANLDLSSFTKNNLEMAIFVYVDDPAQISGIRLDLGDDNQKFFFANQQSANFYQKGWNEIRFKSDDFASQYAPTGWSEIKWLRVNLAAKNNSSVVSAWFDDWQLTSAPPTITPAVQGAAASVNTAALDANPTDEPINNKLKNRLILESIMSNTIVWGIAILIAIGLGVWLTLKLWAKRKTLSDPTNPHSERSGFWSS